jgi:hypothetical protein
MTKRATKVGLVVLVALLTVLIVFAERVVFVPMDMPPASLLPAFIFLSFWDALGFGVGIAILIYVAMNYSKWPKEIRGSLLVLFFIALWFSVLNWVHDGAHMAGAAPPNWLYLALVEYVFHFPWLIFALALTLVAGQLVRAYTKQKT